MMTVQSPHDHRMSETEAPSQDEPAHKNATLIAALGVVFGDIGTSPLYALRESFGGAGATPLDLLDLLGVVSLILWALILVITFKYLLYLLRADNEGEGGIIALVALLNPRHGDAGNSRVLLILVGLFGACLLYGDGTITPAISVLSAIEGLHIAAPGLSEYVIPITLLILVGLFSVQRFGSGLIGRFFGPLMLLWFLVLGLLGLRGILIEPSILTAFNPYHAFVFLADNGVAGYLTLGAVFLVVTGGEALYADLGHFGATPIRRAWLLIAFPGLVLNYLGQAALLLVQPTAIQAPFFHLAPAWAQIPLVVLAAVATIIASQAVISGTFSLTRQAIRLGQLPRMKVVFTQSEESGQVYMPFVNWLLLAACLSLVVGFGSSDKLASAYGVAVSMDMLITSVLALAVTRQFGWNPALIAVAGVVFITIDLAFLGANLVKIPDGGWYALLVAGLIFLLVWTWRNGRTELASRLAQRAITMPYFLEKIEEDPPYRVPGTAVILTSHDNVYVPPALLHHINCTHVLHERLILLTVMTEDRPHVPASERLECVNFGQGIMRVRVHYGFSQPPNIPVALKLGEHIGIPVDNDSVIYMLSRESLVSLPEHSLARHWQYRLFKWMKNNAALASRYYHLPDERVLEIGIQVSM